MSFGRFYPAENRIITNIYGEKVPLNKPSGYGGLFWGSVYDAKGKHIEMASDYFWDREDLNTEDLNAWEEISNFIDDHCSKYIKPYCDDRHHYQSGFGGDECDGLIDFWTKDPIPDMPDMPFEIAGEKYTIRWDYSGGHDDYDEDNEELNLREDE
jgi:hypothetical protein